MADRARWFPCCVAVGSNLDQPVRQVQSGLAALETLEHSRLVEASSLYLNPPLGPVPQDDFVNAVALLLTRMPARRLLECLQAIETRHGRDRNTTVRWGPRRLDLDLLTYGMQVIDEADLRVPHPGIVERNFVLFPLLEIAPNLLIPRAGTVRTLAAALDGSTLRRLA